jgi:hypothetical protein
MIAKEKGVLVGSLQEQRAGSRPIPRRRGPDTDQKGGGTAPPRYARREPASGRWGETCIIPEMDFSPKSPGLNVEAVVRKGARSIVLSNDYYYFKESLAADSL